MAIQLLRKPGDPALPSFGSPLQSGIYARGYARTSAPAVAPTPAATPVTPAPVTPSYTPPAQGTVRGSAGFRQIATSQGLKGININEWGAGLWAYGVDVNKPGYMADVRSLYNAKLASNDTDFQTRVAGELAKKGWSASDDTALANTVDWYYRDASRRQAKTNGFFDSTIGKIVGIAAQVGAAFIPGVGPAASAAVGATIGGVTDGFKGALLGGIGGYGIGKGVQFIQGGGLTSLFSKAAPIVDGSAAATSTVNGVTVSSTQGLSGTTPSLFSRAATAVKGATSNVSLDTAATAVNAGLGVRDLLKGAAVAGGTALAASQLLPASSGAPAPIPEPPAAVKTEQELQRERELRRRRITETNLTWGNTLTAPSVSRPSLWATPGAQKLGGAARLAA